MGDLVPKTDSQIAVQGNDFWAEMGAEDFAIPSVSIGQGTSSKGEIGKYNFNNGSAQPVLAGVSLLVPSKTRTLFAGKGKPTRCGSDNFHNPSERYANPISKNCGTCFAAQWGDDPDKVKLHLELGVKKDINLPICQQTYTMMFLDGDGNPFFMDFRSSALKIVQEKLLSRLRMGFSKSHPATVQFDMSISRNDGKQGVFYEPAFENFRVSDTERSEKALNLYGQYSKRAQALRSEQIAKMDADTIAVSAQQAPAFDAPWPEDAPSDEIPF